MPVRRIDGDLPVDVHHSAGARDDGDRVQVLVAVDYSSTAPSDYDTISASVP